MIPFIDTAHGCVVRTSASYLHAAILSSVGSLLGGVPTAASAQECAWEKLSGISLVGNSVAVHSMATFDDGRGPALYVGGLFSESNGNPGDNITRWDGLAAEPLGRGLGKSAHSLALFDDGTGLALYAAGYFTRAGTVADANRVAKWDGREWSPLSKGMFSMGQFGTDHVVWALTVFDDGTGPALYAGGHFDTAGGVPAKSIAKWDGHEWSPVGAGLFSSSGDAGEVRALVVHNDGTGPALYAAGAVRALGDVVGGVVRWDGAQWRPVGGGVWGRADVLAVVNHGAGEALYVGGQVVEAGGVQTLHVARWAGGAWSALGVGTDYDVRSLGVFDDGRGPALYVGGAFFHAGGLRVNGIGRWDGSTWEGVGSGLWTGSVGKSGDSMAVFDDGDGPALYVGGNFSEAGGVPGTKGIARWKCARCSADCDTSTGVGVLDIFDFLCFQNRFAASDPYACECDTSTGPAVCDIFDFLCFQNRFAAGCP